MAETNPNPTERNGDHDALILNAPDRHHHELRRLEGLKVYTCNGCKQYGANIGYKCTDDGSAPCKNFTLHEKCATLPEVVPHPYPQIDTSYTFRRTTNARHYCYACRDLVRGYVFESENGKQRLHPLCVALPTKLDFGGHGTHKLKFVTGADLKGETHTCSACHSKIAASAWKYRCEDVACNVYVDLSCVKVDILGLSNYGVHTAARISRSAKFKSKIKSVISKTIKTVIWCLL